MGQVCAKHDEYYEKVCPWCEAPEIATDSPLIISAEEFNAHIAEAAAIGREQRDSENIRKNNELLGRLKAKLRVDDLLLKWPKDKAT